MPEPEANWTTQTILPQGFLPMLPTAATGPLESDDHAYEIRWEGQRALIGLEGRVLLARAASGQDCAPWFPELSGVRAAVEPLWALLDAEWIIPERDRASPALLRDRLRLPAAGGAIARAAAAAPAVLIVSDILRIGDSWLLDVPWLERRDILLRAVRPAGVVRLARTFATGAGALAEADRLAQGSLLAKRHKGRYAPGVRSRDWLAIRPPEEVEAILCGWLPGEAEREAALLLAVRQGERLVYAGRAVGPHPPGVLAAVRALPESGGVTIPRGAAVPGSPRWVEPRLVCRVVHHGLLGSGVLRAPEVRALLGATPERSAPAAGPSA
jgi:bifunctional non-homologous end joining protein LigD